MNHSSQQLPVADETSFGVMDILIAILRRKRVLLGFPVIIASIVAVISFALPNIYVASTKLLPPQQAQSGAAALLSQLGGVAGAMAGSAGLKNPSDVYIAMLRSRTIADRLIAKFDLLKVYGVEPFEVRDELKARTTVSAGKDGLISIEVEDEDPQLAARLTNAYVDELVKLSGVFAVTEAAQRRLFFQQQLEQSKNSLARAEVELKRALDTRGVISVDADSRAILETVGRLRAGISAKEIQLSSMRAFVTRTNPDYRRAEEELTSLRSELSKLQNGRPGDTGNDGARPSEAGLENIKILREVKYHQMLYELLAKQYEAARLDESKTSSVIQVLDSAVVPDRKSKPKRLIMVLLAGVTGLLAAVFWILLDEAKLNLLRQPGGRDRWLKFKRSLGFSK